MLTVDTHKNPYTPLLVLVLSVGLVFSFGLHAVQVEHAHFGGAHAHGGEDESILSSLGEYMHLADKKLLALPAGGMLFWMFLIQNVSLWSRLLEYSYTRSLRSKQRYIQVHRALSHLALFFGEGILHAKVH